MTYTHLSATMQNLMQLEKNTFDLFKAFRTLLDFTARHFKNYFPIVQLIECAFYIASELLSCFLYETFIFFFAIVNIGYRLS